MQTIKLIEISKSFKSKKAVNDVNIEFKRNRVNGLLGQMEVERQLFLIL